MKRPMPTAAPIVRTLFALLVGGLLCAALDMRIQGLHENEIPAAWATGALLTLALAVIAVRRPRIRIGAVDLLAALLFAGLMADRWLRPGAAAALRCDETLQAAMIYASFRVLLASDRRLSDLLLMLLCLCGICEAVLGIRQIFGLAASNHGLFRITGTFFNPGPYAGFLAAVLACAAAGLPDRHALAVRVVRSGMWRRPGAALRGIAPCALCLLAAASALVVLPATMSRAAWLATGAVAAALVLGRIPVAHAFRRRPLRTLLLAGALLLLTAGAGFGAYRIKRPSADGRLLMWKIDARILLRHPLAGVGQGRFAGAYGEEQARYFASGAGSEGEMQVAGAPEAGFNDWLQFGAETGVGGLLLLSAAAGIALAGALRRRSPWGCGLLAMTVFASFSYPGSVLPLRLLFVALAAAAVTRPAAGRSVGRQTFATLLLPAALLACWPGFLVRQTARAEASERWREVRIWQQAGRYDYLVEDGEKEYGLLSWDFRFLYDYGYALHKEGRFAESNEVLREGMRLSSDPMFRNIAGKNFEALGDRAQAAEAYRRAHEMIPHRIYPLYLLARCRAADGCSEEAAEAASRALALPVKVESVQTLEMRDELSRLIDSLKRNSP